MATVLDISNWAIKEWIQTIGTRDKFFVEDPETGKQYYFKESIRKYPSEFWSEIIASKLGHMLGFEMLDYNIAIYDDLVGCICESMIDQTHEELEHGIGLIKKDKPAFTITDRPNLYFHDVLNSLKSIDFKKRFIEIMVFDALIGNQDRHSENWAVIKSLQTEKLHSNKSRFVRWAYNNYKQSRLKLKNIPLKKYILEILHQEDMLNIEFSRIYDSGSSLGREIDENQIDQFLNNESKIAGYVKNGRSEIRWDSKKINHFELLTKINIEYRNELNVIIKRVKSQFDEQKIRDLVYTIDDELSVEYEKSKLTLKRKELIYQFICHRFMTLQQVLKNG